MRVGGVDLLLNSLRASKFTDFELVLVDGLYTHRKDLIQQEARDRFLAVRHVGLNQNPFPNCAFCAYSNAGIAASTGDVLVFMVDYSRIPPDLLGKHAAFHRDPANKRRGFMGPHWYAALDVDSTFPRYTSADVDRYELDVKEGRLARFMWSIGVPTTRPDEPHQADGGATVPPDADPKLRLPPGPIGPEFFHAKNESVRREHVLAIDGWDQDLDGAHLYQDSDFADRLSVKVGVEWELDPKAIVDIVNPRHVFPFARRSRPHEENYKIWQAKKAAGYPAVKPLHAIRVLEEKPKTVPAEKKKMKLAMVYGEFSSAIHGPFDLEGLYTRTGLTGSESSFFNLARSLAEKDHDVVVFCKCERPYQHPSGFQAMPIPAIQVLPQLKGLDAVIAWNEPDYLQFAPLAVKRYCDQQLNDWGYCRNDQWRNLVDHFVFPSEHSRQHHIKDEKLSEALTRGSVIPNSVDLDLFSSPPSQRHSNRAVWCSSPDRGLHLLLSMWPQVRKKVPNAELRIFYRLAPWLARAKDSIDAEVGKRARYIEMVLPKLAAYGVQVVDLVPNVQMAQELMAARVMVYPCAPVRYTEGFGCSVLDAAAAGCVAVISDADALPSVHGNSAAIIPGDPATKVDLWVDTVASMLQLNEIPKEWQVNMKAHANAHSREAVASQWETLLMGTPSSV